MPGVLDRYKKKNVMGGNYSGDETLNITGTISIVDDVVYIDGISTDINVKGSTGATGKSAYEIAVDNGFEGTETEWLDSLKAKDGETNLYTYAVENGLFDGTKNEFLEAILNAGWNEM